MSEKVTVDLNDGQFVDVLRTVLNNMAVNDNDAGMLSFQLDIDDGSMSVKGVNMQVLMVVATINGKESVSYRAIKEVMPDA